MPERALSFMAESSNKVAFCIKPYSDRYRAALFVTPPSIRFPVELKIRVRFHSRLRESS